MVVAGCFGSGQAGCFGGPCRVLQQHPSTLPSVSGHHFVVLVVVVVVFFVQPGESLSDLGVRKMN